MDLKTCLKLLREIKSVTFGTVDEFGNPQVRIIDIMCVSEDNLYFLTAKGKNFYKELLNQKKVGISGLTKDYQAIRINATTKKLDNSEKYINKMFINNPSMNEVYPGVSRSILEAFTLDNGEVEFFDLSQSPIHRESFSLNGGDISQKGFCISDECISCGTCYDICPQNAIKEGNPYSITQENCLHCGLCFENCPSSAIYKRSDFKC